MVNRYRHLNKLALSQRIHNLYDFMDDFLDSKGFIEHLVFASLYLCQVQNVVDQFEEMFPGRIDILEVPFLIVCQRTECFIEEHFRKSKN